MLWWIIGVWLASGAVIPVLWLLSMASRGVFARDLWAEQRQVTVGSDNAAAPARPLQSQAAALSAVAQLSATPAPSDTDAVDEEASRGNRP